MTTVDLLLREAVKAAYDDTLRGAAADCLQEAHGEAELADALRTRDTGPPLLEEAAALAAAARLPLTWKVLWAAYALAPRLGPRLEHMVYSPPGRTWASPHVPPVYGPAVLTVGTSSSSGAPNPDTEATYRALAAVQQAQTTGGSLADALRNAGLWEPPAGVPDDYDPWPSGT